MGNSAKSNNGTGENMTMFSQTFSNLKPVTVLRLIFPEKRGRWLPQIFAAVPVPEGEYFEFPICTGGIDIFSADSFSVYILCEPVGFPGIFLCFRIFFAAGTGRCNIWSVTVGIFASGKN